MNTKFSQFRSVLAGLALAASLGALQASQHVISSFDTSASTNGWAFQNWNNSTGAVSWSTNDSGGNAASGSLQMSTVFTTTENGGAYRLPVNDFNGTGYTALEYDYKVDPGSALDTNGYAADFKVGVFTTGAYNFHANDFNAVVTTTNNGWAHMVLPASSLGGTEWSDIKEVDVQWYDSNYTNTSPVTATVYIDNIKFTGPNATYSNYTAFTFDDATSLGGVFTNWYGHPVAVLWTTNDATGQTNSGSAEIVANFTEGDNNVIIGLWINTNGTFINPDTNSFNGAHYASVDFDMLWDTNLSTVTIDQFNSLGDITGFPMGLMEGPTQNFSAVEAMGASTVSIPGGASNGWVHMSLPINDATVGLSDVVGLYFKKYNYQGSGIDGTAAFFIDNVTFIGGPVTIPQPILTLSRPVSGLQIVNNGGGPYDRESLETFYTDFSFVDQSTPVTYSLNIAQFPSANYSGYAARIYLTPNAFATEAAVDYTEANVIMIDINRNSDNSATTTIRCKTNSPSGNGDLYDAGLPSFNASGVIGKWSYSFTSNTNILVTAPDGTHTNLPMPLNLSSSDVENYFGGGQMEVYFGGYNNGAANIGQRVVLANASITQGSTTLLSDNFQTDTSLNINNGGGSSGLWSFASGGATPASLIYLLPTTTTYFLDWSVPADGFIIQTNSSLTNPSGWSTNTGVIGTQVGDHYHTEFGTTNLPPSGPLFFRLVN